MFSNFEKCILAMGAIGFGIITYSSSRVYMKNGSAYKDLIQHCLDNDYATHEAEQRLIQELCAKLNEKTV